MIADCVIRVENDVYCCLFDNYIFGKIKKEEQWLILEQEHTEPPLEFIFLIFLLLIFFFFDLEKKKIRPIADRLVPWGLRYSDEL